MNLHGKNRDQMVNRQLERLTLPRFQMLFILLLTGCVGFLSSVLMLHLGVSRMWMRYPLAILSAYGAFLLLLRLWLAFQRHSGDLDLGSDIDIPIPAGNKSASRTNYDFGGGTGGSYGAGNSDISSIAGGGSTPDGGSILDGGFDLDAEGIALVILAVVALVGGLIASFYIIYIAPVLLAEIIVDGLLLRGLKKRIENLERASWLQNVIRKTALPAALCGFFFCVAGGVLQSMAPQAQSIGEVLSSTAKPNASR